MLYSKYLSDTDNARLEIRFLRILAGGLALALIVSAGAALKLSGTEKTIVLPPDIKRSFWVSGASASKEYLEEMAYFYAGLALNITPAVSEYQNKLFLHYAAPAEYGRLQAELGARAAFLKKNNASTHFAVRTISTDDEALRVALSGTLSTWASDKKAGDRSVTYVVGFRLMNGRLYVTEFRETESNNPLVETEDAK